LHGGIGGFELLEFRVELVLESLAELWILDELGASSFATSSRCSPDWSMRRSYSPVLAMMDGLLGYRA
jgi:hypothetical protein